MKIFSFWNYKHFLFTKQWCSYFQTNPSISLEFKKIYQWIDGAYDLIMCFRQINEIPKRISGMIHGYYHQNIHRLTNIQIIHLLGRKE